MYLILMLACGSIPSDNAEELETVTRHEVVIEGGQSGELCPGMPPYQLLYCYPESGSCRDITADTDSIDGCLTSGGLPGLTWSPPVEQEYRLYWLD